MSTSLYNSVPHRRKNILTGDWVLVSPQRTQRPWQGEVVKPAVHALPAYDPECYLCPGNARANGTINPKYDSVFAFTNDFSALLQDVPSKEFPTHNLLIAKKERGICRVVNFSPRHDLTFAAMTVSDIEAVIRVWRDEYRTLGTIENIKYVQIFENKGAMMGNSNPHPHCQIWAQESIPMEPRKELVHFKRHYEKRNRSLLGDYIREELGLWERIVYENGSFVVIVPFWAVWPYETILIPKRKVASLLRLRDEEIHDFADSLKIITMKYDALFQTSFPYSAGIHSAPTDGHSHPEWHLHMHFYPPLLRSAAIKKFMVGYEMMAEPQRDITAEAAAERLRSIDVETRGT
jgi:UDPglucose--hexose-1-phosphate uridylyltransferase